MAIIKIVNAEGGSDARYDVSRMTAEERRQFDSEGRPLGADNPDQWTWTPGLPGARGGNDNAHMGMPGGGGGGGGGGALLSHPIYQQMLAATNSAAAADAASRRTGVQQALISFGLVPGGFKDQYGDVDDLTRQLAAQNTEAGLSTRARLLQARSDAIRSFTNALSARGLRRSGAKGYGLRRRQLDFDQAHQDALSKLLGYTGDLYSRFGQNEYQRQLSLANALMNLSQSFNFGGGGGGGGGGGFSAPSIDPYDGRIPAGSSGVFQPNTIDLFQTSISTTGRGAGGGGFTAM